MVAASKIGDYRDRWGLIKMRKVAKIPQRGKSLASPTISAALVGSALIHVPRNSLEEGGLRPTLDHHLRWRSREAVVETPLTLRL
jgi:hypothetical protein